MVYSKLMMVEVKVGTGRIMDIRDLARPLRVKKARSGSDGVDWSESAFHLSMSFPALSLSTNVRQTRGNATCRHDLLFNVLLIQAPSLGPTYVLV